MFCFLCTVLGLATVTFAQYVMEVPTHIQLSPNENILVMDASVACAEYTGANDKIIKRFFELKLEPDETTKDFIYCVLVSLEYASVEGHITKNIVSLFDDHPFQNDVAYVYETCKTKDKLRYIDTLYEELSCFFAKTPIRLGETVEK